MATITSLAVLDSGATSRTTINTNFTNLNTDKVEATGVATLTNKTIALASNTVSGTTAQFNTALTDNDFATLAGTETLTNKQMTTIELGHATDTTISRSAAGVLAVEGVVIPSISSTNTLTNKRVNPRFTTATNYTTSTTIDSDANDQYIVTAQAGALLFNNPTGTPVDGQTLLIAVTGTAARALTYGTAFEASTVALPTTTVTTARLNIGFIWRADTSKFVCIASA